MMLLGLHVTDGFPFHLCWKPSSSWESSRFIRRSDFVSIAGRSSFESTWGFFIVRTGAGGIIQEGGGGRG